MKKSNLINFISDALAIEAEEAKEVGSIGYMARSLIQATLPHSKISENEFQRTNGLFRLIMLANWVFCNNGS